MNINVKIISVTLLLCFASAVFAWNNAGHRIIAQIAYDQLTPAAKEKVDALTNILFHSKYPDARFLRAATWPDRIRSQTTAYNAWHYIDLPYAQDNIQPTSLNSYNVVWAIQRAENIVSDSSNSPQRRAKYLSFLIHFVGDIHQPLHCVTLYSNQFPNGDKGGNDFPIDSSVSKNLHWFWDEGLGMLTSPQGHYQFHYDQVQQIAKQWMAEYPQSFFGAKLQETSLMQWAQEERQIAIHDVYTLQPNIAPSTQYRQHGQTIVKQQIVLAGDRLALILNKIVN